MPSVRRKPGSSIWYACYTDGSGVQRQVSTGLKGKTEAFQLAVAYEGAGQLDLAEAEAIAEVQKIFARARGQSVTQISIDRYLRSWLEDRRGEVEPGSWTRYESSIVRFIEFLGQTAHLPLHRCSESHIAQFRRRRMEVVSPATANADLNVLRFAFKKALKKRLIVVDPTAELENLSSKSANGTSNRRPFTKDELERLLHVADAEWRGMIFFGLYTVQRLGDIAQIRWSQVQNGVLNITRAKTGKQAIVPLHSAVKSYLSRLPAGKQSDSVFPSAAHILVETGRSSQLSNQFYKLLVAAGLAEKRSKKNTGKGHGAARSTNELSFHCLRHTGNTWLKEGGAGEAIVRDIVGHESTDVSRIYTHIDEATKRAAINRLPVVGRVAPKADTSVTGIQPSSQ